MKLMPLQQRGISNSRLVYGCMGLGGGWNRDPLTAEDYRNGEQAVEAALEIGITMFDHADIYKMGKSESVFGHVLKQSPGLREKLVIQSKCGIRFGEGALPGRYDFSKEHILHSVDGILNRLGVEYLDILLLHRPDPLMEPEEVGEALKQLKAEGKVRNFGVSNMDAAQIRFLERSCPEPMIVNQLEMSLARLDWVDHGVHVNQKAGAEVGFADGLLEYCQMEHIQIQAWGPLAQGVFSGRLDEKAAQNTQKTAELVGQMAKQQETTPEAIVLGWLMRHPAMIQPVVGTANPERIRACGDAERVSQSMTREEWYTLYVSSRGNTLP
jgi:predicted oxidoreductase